MDTKTARGYIETAITQLDEMRNGGRYAHMLRDALAIPTRGTIKKFFESVNDKKIDTLQLTLNIRGAVDIVDSWEIQSRGVTRLGATFVEMDDSRRDFTGVTTVASNDTTYLGTVKWGEDRIQVILYTISLPGRDVI